MNASRILFVFAIASFVTLVACSSDSSTTGDQASSCTSAKQVSDDCAKQSDGGSSGSVTVTFDEAKCESGGAQAKTAADCIVTNKSNCDCVLKCSLAGSC
jgi:hypothetical protein